MLLMRTANSFTAKCDREMDTQHLNAFGIPTIQTSAFTPSTKTWKGSKTDPKRLQAEQGGIGAKKVQKKSKENRTCIARCEVASKRNEKMMLLDSGTSSHMVKDKPWLAQSKQCNIQVSLGFDSRTVTGHREIHNVVWSTENVETEYLSAIHCTEKI